MSAERVKGALYERLKERLQIEGIMPERALLRLKRAGIAVYNVKKTQKNQILLSVKKKDCEKVFAIFQSVWYNISVSSPYTVQKRGGVGVAKYLKRAKNRVGLFLGALLFCASTLFLDGFTFGVELVGSDIYAREVHAALEENGFKPFTRYRSGNEDLVCARLLAIDDVEFCSVRKSGGRVVVEVRLSPFAGGKMQAGNMLAGRTGTLLSMTVLKGTPLVKAGENVEAGTPLVGGYLQTESGKFTEVAPIARASIACTYEADIAAEDEQSAFAQAYLELALSQKDELTDCAITENGETFHVKLEYTVIQTVNF